MLLRTSNRELFTLVILTVAGSTMASLPAAAQCFCIESVLGVDKGCRERVEDGKTIMECCQGSLPPGEDTKCYRKIRLGLTGKRIDSSDPKCAPCEPSFSCRVCVDTPKGD